ncbi:MAG TPA: hypothetical protein DCS93_10360 [Microscillaceae bacterium]|nr:hypothetical protein [Microscillaceae bacterium]
MKNFKITILILSILGSFSVQAQNPYWALYSLKKLDLSSNAISNLPGSASTCGTANAHGLFDASGNPVFYANHNRIYDKNGQVKFTIPGPPYCVKGLHIVPIPNGSCGEYYVIYVKVTELGAFPNGGAAYDGYEVGAVRVTVDANQNIVVSNNIHRVTYADFPIVISTAIETALSKESNQERTLYVSFRRSASPNFNTDQIVKIRVNNAGLTKDGGFMSTKNGPLVHSHSLELSPDQSTLAWIQWTPGVGEHLAVRNLATGTISNIFVPNLDYLSEVEFGANSDDIYVITTQGVAKTSISNPQTSVVIPGTSSIHYTGDIELGPNNKLYITATNNQLYTIVGQTTTAVASYASLALPQQVDGETIQYSAPAPLTIYLSMLISGQTQANVVGGSGNYTYTWTGSSGTQTVNPVLLCGRGTHTITVRDNASGCSTSLSFTNYPSFGCRSTNSNVELNNTTVKTYPNPTTDYLNVQVNHDEKIVQLQVTNLQGKVLNQLDGNQRAGQRITIGDLKTGAYLLTIMTDKLRHQVKFFVK